MRLFNYLIVTSFFCFIALYSTAHSTISGSVNSNLLRKELIALYGDQDPVFEFYESRDFSSFWLSDNKNLSGLIEALNIAEKHGLEGEKYFIERLRSGANSDGISYSPHYYEIIAMKSALRFVNHISSGMLKPTTIAPEINVYPQVPKASEILFKISNSDDIKATIFEFVPKDPDYNALLNELEKLKLAARYGFWGQPVPSNELLGYGAKSHKVVKLRTRLYKMGYLDLDNGSEIYDVDLVKGVKRFQTMHGLNSDGIAGKFTLDAINISPETRIVQVIVNLERIRWNNFDYGKKYIRVNQPNFRAELKEEGSVIWSSRVVVGLPEFQTAEFSDIMTHLIINPTWHVPKSIAVDEYLPLMQENPDFIANNDMVLLIKGTSKQVDSTLIDMNAFTPENFPFEIKQNPSNLNALGLVKFMFPNRFSIYMHDTPSKELFFRDERTFSHGCIRVQDPFDFAHVLLTWQLNDPIKGFANILEKNKETQINLDNAVPVNIQYRTVFKGQNGKINYRSDIYGRDAMVFINMVDAGLIIDI